MKRIYPYHIAALTLGLFGAFFAFSMHSKNPATGKISNASAGVVTTFWDEQTPTQKVALYTPELDSSPTPTPIIEQAPEPTSVPAQSIETPVHMTPPAAARPTAIPKPATSYPTGAKPVPATCVGGFAEQFLCLLNEYRASKGKGTLSYDSGLNQVSLTHSSWMNATKIFSHTGGGGSSFADRCSAGGVTCPAENLANGAGSAQHLLTMWKNSAGHNKNLLGPYSVIGIGISGGYTTTLFR